MTHHISDIYVYAYVDPEPQIHPHVQKQTEKLFIFETPRSRYLENELVQLLRHNSDTTFLKDKLDKLKKACTEQQSQKFKSVKSAVVKLPTSDKIRIQVSKHLFSCLQ